MFVLLFIVYEALVWYKNKTETKNNTQTFSEVLRVVTVFITGTKVFISTITLYTYNHLKRLYRLLC